MSVIGISPSDIANGARIIARGIHSLKEDDGAKHDYQQLTSNLESRLAALDWLGKFESSSSSTNPSGGFYTSIRDILRQEEEEIKRLERYKAKLGRHAPAGKRQGVVEKLKWEFEGEPQALSHNQRTAPGFEALILKSIIFGAEENRERDDQIQKLITRLAADTVHEVRSHASNLTLQLQEAVRTQKELINQHLSNLQSGKQPADIDKPIATKFVKSRPLRKRKLLTGSFPNRQKRKSQTSPSGPQQHLRKPAAWQQGVESWLTIIFLASGTACASPSAWRSLHRLKDRVQGDPVLAWIVFVAAMCILKFWYRLPHQLSLLSDSSVSFEDAFGVRFQIPFLHCSEFEIFRGFLEVHYKNQPGLRRVLHRQYLIVLGGHQSNVIDPEKWPHMVKPRSRLTMFMVMVTGKYTCPKCQGRLHLQENSRAFCNRCDEHHMIAGNHVVPDGSSVEELEDVEEEEEEEEQDSTENKKSFENYISKSSDNFLPGTSQNNEDSDEDDKSQDFGNSNTTHGPNSMNGSGVVNRVAEVDRIDSAFKHMVLSHSKWREAVEEAEMELESAHYPFALYPVEPNPNVFGNAFLAVERYRLEKTDYRWTTSSWTKLTPSQKHLQSRNMSSNSCHLIKGFQCMSRDRRAEIYRLLNFKNSCTGRSGKLWYVTDMSIIKSRTKRHANGPSKVEVFCMEIVIKQMQSPTVLYLESRNGTFEHKGILIPPYGVLIGCQNNIRVALPSNGYFDSKVVSRSLAEIWVDSGRRIWIQNMKYSGSTYVNGSRLLPGKSSRLQQGDILRLNMDRMNRDPGNATNCTSILAQVRFARRSGLQRAGLYPDLSQI